jgi:hypothetical protein
VGFPPVGPTDGPSVPPSIPDSDIPHSVPDSGNTLLLSLSSVSLLLACGKRFSRK